MKRNVTLTRQDTREWAGLSLEILSPSFGNAHPKFTYAVAKNYNTRIKPEVESLKAAEDKDEGWKAYEDARIELAKKHARKDADGNPLTQGTVFLLHDRAAFDKDLEALQTSDEHKEAYTRHEEMMAEKLDLDLHTFPLSKVPEKIAGPISLIMLDIIIDDEEEEKEEKE